MDVWRSVLFLASLIALISLGGRAISHIRELYDGLCPVQGPGMADYLNRNSPLGYCTGIGDDLGVLGFIVAVAVIALTLTVLLWRKVTWK